MIEDITFVSGNAKKAERLALHLKIPIHHLDKELVEIQAASLEEVVKYKTREAFQIVRSTVLVEDVSLGFNAHNGMPGPYIKDYLKANKCQGLCKMLDCYKDRGAIAQVCYGLFDGKILKTFKGEAKGIIVASPRGSENFGWDPIFQPLGFNQTWAEMTDARNERDLNYTSMRRKALKKLEAYLLAINKNSLDV